MNEPILPEVREHAQRHHGHVVTEQYICGHPGCGNVLGERQFVVPVSPGSAARRAARKRARQNRKRGRS
jgi:hypothetical protein